MSGSSLTVELFVLLVSPLAIVFIGLLAYATYRAFALRRASLVPSYRHQALWAGASSLYWIILFAFVFPSILNILYPGTVSALNGALGVFSIASICFALVFYFAWIDAIVPIARNSDPRNRDPLRWRYFRLGMWTAILLDIAFSLYFFTASVLAGGATAAIGPLYYFLLFLSDDGAFFIFLSAISVAILLVCLRQSEDKFLRRHLKWLTAYYVVLVITDSNLFLDRMTGFISTFGSLPHTTATGSFLLEYAIAITINCFQALSVYMCVRSLAPISHFPPKEIESKTMTK
jgi:hypothetical protein